jgi:hypothetical protein
MPGQWGVTPRQSVDSECERRGRGPVVAGCILLLTGHAREVDDDLVRALGGPAADQVLDGAEGGKAGYWPRVWAARGLLHVWDIAATDALRAAATDPSWRVREMVAKVVAKHRVDALLDAVVAMRTDSVPRVQRAAERAVISLTQAG